MIKIAPSILSADFSSLGDELEKIQKNGADYVHIDVMDGIFVPNITLGPPVIKCIRSTSKLIFDVHLMIQKPEDHIQSFAQAGADIITVHVEACKHLHRTIQCIKSYGKRAGVALNPSTDLYSIEWVLNDVDMILLMTVNPGFGGQSYIESVTPKIAKLYSMVKEKNLSIDIEVDGGIDLNNIKKVKEAGANIIVSGSTIFNSSNQAHTIKLLRE